MDGIINVKAFGSHISKDSQTAGVRGEAGVSYLCITFDESWDGFAKRVIFWDAQGKNPVTRTLVAHEPGNVRLFIVVIPGEAMAVSGKMTFVIDGMVENKLKRRVSDTLVVKDSPMDAEPTEPSPNEYDAIRQDIENLRGDIQKAFESEDQAEEYRNEAKECRDNAQTHEDNAYRYSMNAMQHWTDASEARGEAEQFAAKAQNAIGKVPYVGENGNWFAWDGSGEVFYDTGVRAQSGAVVYYGDNPSDEVDVWIDPNGECANYAPYIGENGNWYTFDEETQTFKDSGHSAKPSLKYNDLEEKPLTIQPVDEDLCVTPGMFYDGISLLIVSSPWRVKVKSEFIWYLTQMEIVNKDNRFTLRTRTRNETEGTWSEWEYFATDKLIGDFIDLDPLFLGQEINSIVDAINYLTYVFKEDVGDKSQLKTTDKSSLVAAINELYDLGTATRSFVTIYGGSDNWTEEAVINDKGETVGYRYGQVVNVNNAVITPRSKVDLQVTSEQMVVFYEKDLAFVAENDDGVVTVYCVGNVPEHDYTIQAIVTEVV